MSADMKVCSQYIHTLPLSQIRVCRKLPRQEIKRQAHLLSAVNIYILFKAFTPLFSIATSTAFVNNYFKLRVEVLTFTPGPIVEATATFFM